MKTSRPSLRIVAMGPGQMLTAVAALRCLNLDPSGGAVLYRGLPSKAIDEVFERLGSAFGLRYEGHANVDTSVPSRGGRLDKWRAALRPRHYLRLRLAGKTEQLDQLEADTVVISVRHDSPADAFMIAALAPTTLVLTADGVIVGPPRKHGLEPAEKRVAGLLGSDYPLPAEVWTPSYLVEFAAKVGRSRVIPDEVLSDVFDTARTALASLAPLGYDHVVLGQHLALSGLTTELEEQFVWQGVFAFIQRRHPGSSVLYKAHPRDRGMKRILLRQAISEEASVHFTDDQNWAMPLEAMALPAQAHVYGFSSSALLYSASLGKRPAIVLCSRSWPEALVVQITRFVEESGLPLEWIDES